MIKKIITRNDGEWFYGQNHLGQSGASHSVSDCPHEKSSVDLMYDVIQEITGNDLRHQKPPMRFW